MKHGPIFALCLFIIAHPAKAEADKATQELYNLWWGGMACYFDFSDTFRKWQANPITDLSQADRKKATGIARSTFEQQVSASDKMTVCVDVKRKLDALGWRQPS